MKETDLFIPCKNLLESMGFKVKGEINHLDLLAIKDDYLVAVELKTSISLKLIYQALERQKLVHKVYVALPFKKLNLRSSSVKSFMMLLKRLDIGLIRVTSYDATVLVESEGFDLNQSIKRNKPKREKLLKEFSLRKDDTTLGGTKEKRMTHYREKVIQIAKYLYEFGEKSPREIVMYTGIKDAPLILRKNYYLWFINVRRGVYAISLIGIKEIEPYMKNEIVYEDL